MIFDADDLYEGHDRLDLLHQLKAANPALRMTAFAVVGRCADSYIDSLPAWIEPVPHGYAHGDPPTDGGECRDWSADRMRDLIAYVEEASPRWARGFKAPGWIISDGCYEALAEAGWWCADHPDNDARRPDGLRTHVVYTGDHAHHHIQDTCGNGLCESWASLYPRVTDAASFELVSESVTPWRARVAA